MIYAALLSGKTAVVTSGAHGMGRYIAEVFARHGAKVIVNGLAENGAETGEYLNEISPGSYFLRCDMSSEAEVENFTSEVLSREEAVDIAVNNVGINHYELFEYVTECKFFRAQRVNIGGTIQITRAFLPGMARRGVGAFVHISTVHSV
ncbi:MAG: SDR family oxidoreductase, partial [Defluviitaleaceae bacterium]|nr:SDR family oxidoreductase [Defluviitaleaceae bacterium]